MNSFVTTIARSALFTVSHRSAPLTCVYTMLLYLVNRREYLWEVTVTVTTIAKNVFIRLWIIDNIDKLCKLLSKAVTWHSTSLKYGAPFFRKRGIQNHFLRDYFHLWPLVRDFTLVMGTFDRNMLSFVNFNFFIRLNTEKIEIFIRRVQGRRVVPFSDCKQNAVVKTRVLTVFIHTCCYAKSTYIPLQGPQKPFESTI